MGLFAGIAAALASVVGSVVATVGSLVASAVAAATIAVSSIITTVTSTIGNIVSSITSALSAKTLHTTVMIDGITVPIEVTEATLFTKLSAWAKAIKASFSAFLTAIHFDTIVTINEIAYLTSSSYRNMMERVYGKLGEFSAAIGRSTGFIETAIQLARKTSLEVSSFLGKSYDIAEIVWLKDFNKLLGKINDTSSLYAKNPSQIWTDIDELIVKPAIDAKAEAQITMFATVKSAIGMVKSLDDTLTTVQANFGAAVEELPAKWRNDVLPFVDKVSDEIKSWRDGIFAPTIEVIDKVIDVIYTRTTEAKATMQEIAARLARGGNLLANIDNLPDEERIEQQGKISEVTSRLFRERSELWLKEVDKRTITLESILAAIKFELAPEFWAVPELAGLVMPVGKQAKDKKSWFVGDY